MNLPVIYCGMIGKSENKLILTENKQIKEITLYNMSLEGKTPSEYVKLKQKQKINR